MGSDNSVTNPRSLCSCFQFVYLFGVVGQAQPRWRLAVREFLDPFEEVVAPIAVRHRDVPLVTSRLKKIDVSKRITVI